MRHAILVLTLAGAACAAPPEAPHLEELGPVAAVEVRFGTSYCRRLTGADEIAALVAFYDAHRTGWGPFWGEAPEPSIRVEFESDAAPRRRLGLETGQLVASIDGRPAFRAISNREAQRFLELVGGPALGEPEVPCEPRDLPH